MAKTGHPNFDYTCQGYWRGLLHNFSIVGNHSGTSFGQSDAQTFMEGTASPYALCFGVFQCSSIVVVASRYYDGQASAPVFAAEYNEANPVPTPLVPTGLAYGTDTSEDYLPLEVCCDLSSDIGLSATSKPVYNRKYLRGVPKTALAVGTENSPVFTIATAGVAAASSLGNGDLYGGRYYISPGARSADNWVASTQCGNHQIPRGRKRKATSAGSGVSASKLLEDAIALAGGVVLAGA